MILMHQLPYVVACHVQSRRVPWVSMQAHVPPTVIRVAKCVLCVELAKNKLLCALGRAIQSVPTAQTAPKQRTASSQAQALVPGAAMRASRATPPQPTSRNACKTRR
mmetsp:Transcript_95537/g.139543  ORF Transcript_95537/g.139543 Transcript_95537/m.139543 type:complete len:107 (+) Transcript_95537:183-503(+)